jgi:hypothetical protein
MVVGLTAESILYGAQILLYECHMILTHCIVRVIYIHIRHYSLLPILTWSPKIAWKAIHSTVGYHINGHRGYRRAYTVVMDLPLSKPD